MPPSSTIIITGGNGVLGSKVAFFLTQPEPKRYHISLAARNTSSPAALRVDQELRDAGIHFSWEALDLASLENIRAFTRRIKEKIAAGELPPLTGIIHSAAINRFTRGPKTKDGFDELYAVNVLAPFLLTVELLPLMAAGGVVVNVASSMHKSGRVDFFWDAKAAENNDADEKLGISEGMARYGSSKLLLVMLGYKLQELLKAKNCPVQVISLDPGGMSGNSALGAQHWIINILKPLMEFFAPLLRKVDRSVMNPPEVPAKAIARLFSEETRTNGGVGGKFFVLDEQMASSPTSLDTRVQGHIWRKVLADLKLSETSVGLSKDPIVLGG